MSTAAHSSAFPSLRSLRLSAYLPLAGLCLFCGLLFFYGLGDRDLLSSHEARAAQNAQMMLDEGHWLVPRLFDQHLELQKPPLYYWLVAALAWLRGGSVDGWAVRLPAAISALLTVLFVYFLGVQTGRQRAGWFSALILASSLHFTWMAHVGRIDMPLTLVVTVALGAFYLGERSNLLRWHALGYTALGAGLLLKGPIAVVLPAVVAGTVWLYRNRLNGHAHLQQMRQTSLWWGVPWMLAIAGPWYGWANWQTHNQLWEVFFWYHNVERGLGGAEALKAYPWWYYGPRLLLDLLPWSLVLPAALYGMWRQRDVTKNEDAWLGLLWFGVMVGFLSCMRFKRADYLLPAYPGLALFLGVWLERQAESLKARGLLLGFLLVYGSGWLLYHSWETEAQGNHRLMAQEIRRQTKGPVIFFRAESHLLTHHLGKPVATILEWENLAIWAQRPFPVYVVMPAACADEWPQHLSAGALEEVLHSDKYVQGSRRPLVVLRNRAACGLAQR